MYLDAHTHLADEAFDEDRNDCIHRMLDLSMIKCNLIGESVDAVEKSLLLRQQHPQLFDVSCGLHPASIQFYTADEMAYYKSMIFDARIDCVGEIGLDYHWYPETKSLQQKWFIEQIEWANLAKKPIMIHCREAIQDCYDILKNHRPVYGCVMHSYSGSLEMAREFIKIGCHLSVGGVVTFKNAKQLKEVVAGIDLKYLLSETDAPYLTPTPYRGKRNEPAYVKYVVEKIAQIKNMDVNTVATQIAANYQQIFHPIR